MSDSERGAVTMDDREIDRFLGDGGVGVLSLARDDDAYALPVSYGYDDGERAVYLRLAFAPDSEKRSYVDAGGRVALVVQREGPTGWQSVVARGRLHSAGETEAALDSSVAAAIRRVNIPFVAVYDRPARDLEFSLYRLEPDTMTGRRERSGEAD
jgi:hypothetical protein